MIGKVDNLLDFHATVLRLRADRQQLLASNIANADTPNYKARDIEFSSALKGALTRSGRAPGELAKTSAVHLSGVSKAGSVSTSTLYRTEQQGSVDGNTVDMDVERNQFTDNAIRYDASLTMINAQIKSLLAALQGQ
jgi:flagellar basal-body rod protein FlgB